MIFVSAECHLLKFLFMGVFNQTFADKASRKDLHALLWFPAIQVTCSGGIVNTSYGVDSDKNNLFSPGLCQYLKL